MNRVIDVWRHMTVREKLVALAASLLYGSGLGIGFGYVMAAVLSVNSGGAGLVKGVVAVIALCFLIRVFMRWQKSFYASTVWARSNGIVSDDMSVADFYKAAFWSIGLHKHR